MSEISRVTRSKDEARKSYDAMSRWYDFLAGDSERKYRNLGLQYLNIQAGENVLEIGFGTGQAVIQLAQSVGETGRVSGVDISEGMKKVAAARVDRAGLVERVVLQRGDATTLNFGDRSFNAIFMCFTLELFDTPEIPVVLDECNRVLAPEGRLCVVAMSVRGKPNIITSLYNWAHRVMPRFVDCRPISVRDALSVAGFMIAKETVSTMWGLPVEIILVTKKK
jgi:ubiquinone/menaquinone biosynthesis C-methylase UbiE